MLHTLDKIRKDALDNHLTADVVAGIWAEALRSHLSEGAESAHYDKMAEEDANTESVLGHNCCNNHS